MSNIGIQFHPLLPRLVLRRLFEPPAALVAEIRPCVIFYLAFGTMNGQFSAGHCDKETMDTVNNFQVPNNETVVKRQRTKRFESL